MSVSRSVTYAASIAAVKRDAIIEYFVKDHHDIDVSMRHKSIGTGVRWNAQNS